MAYTITHAHTCSIHVDRYADQNIPDLTGAVQDAKALWALFSDSIPGIDANLLTDEKASLINIEEALEKTLLGAVPDDTVILSFSGHGSDTHRLVPHDAELTDVLGSGLPMGRLAELFQRYQAKKLLLLQRRSARPRGTRLFPTRAGMNRKSDAGSGSSGE
ncbi:caspase family protein [Meiothermus granaticius]|uniref:Caspase domain protein n=1 Tax=Meiothermus granaticius NBRC 107808 TaxID=1227551 RepID=A0A399FET9_9DEIN|nr:caspase family protein [Meiothermus granaticius]MCL6527550.1 caspase family protein [Thermaceae bacterium]RIH93541.1 Caspase domain protein [Meiothermus granaticius NBRC 107808]GEM86037.1 hypothetical protein MGR01S_06620 [Meiothermus granaticius NBRC 107808]